MDTDVLTDSPSALQEAGSCKKGEVSHMRILNKRKVHRFHRLTLILASLICENQRNQRTFSKK